MMKKNFPHCCEGDSTVPRTLVLHWEMRFVVFVTAAGSFAESTPYVCFCFATPSEFDEIVPVILLLIRFISSFRLSSFSVLQLDTLSSQGKFMSTSSFLIHILLVVSWFCFVEVGEKRAMGKQKRKMSV